MATATAVKERPWAARAAELWDRDGIWSDFAAFCEWFSGQLSDELQDWWDNTDSLDQIAIYTICCGLCD